MGQTIKFDLIGGFNTEESNAWNMQKSLNWYVSTSEKGRNNTALLPTAGVTLHSNLTGYSFTGPFITDAHSNVWTVARFETGVSKDFGYSFAKLDYKGVAPTVYSNYTFGNTVTAGADLGYNLTQDALNLYLVAAASNIDTTTPETAANIILTADKRDPTNTLARILTPVGIRSSDIAYMDGWIVVNHIPSWGNYKAQDSNLGIFFVGAAQGNTTTIGSKYDYMYIQTDYVKRIMPNNGYLYLFGDQHYEIWYNTGNQDFPFEPVKEATQGVGLARHWLITQHLDTIYFVGKVRNDSLGVYALKGLELSKVSTQAIDNALRTRFADSGSGNNWRSCGMFTEVYNNNTFLYLASAGLTMLVYNLTTGLWHEDENSSTLQVAFGDSVAFDEPYIRCGLTSIDYGDLDTATSILAMANYQSSINLSNGVIARERISPHIASDDPYLYHNRVRIDLQFPTKVPNDANIDSNIILYSSDDDGKTWNSHGMKSINRRAYGNVSGDKRLEWFRLGRSEDRVYKLWTNANAQITITGAWLEAESGYR